MSPAVRLRLSTPRWRRFVGGFGIAASVGLTGCVEGLFFHPDGRDYTTPQRLGLASRDLRLASGDATLHGWWLPAEGAARATVVHAHGNAANIGNHLPLVAWLPAAGLNVLLFDYRGFGRSTGKPTLDGAVEDLRAAIATARREAPGSRIVLLGQSLGGATAIRAAAAEQDAGATDIVLLVVEAAFDSYRGIARDVASGPLVVLRPLLLALPGTADDPATAIARLRLPVLLIHGDADRVIPFAHSERLHAAAREPKTLLRVRGADHMQALDRDDVRAATLAAIDAALR